MVPKDHQPGKFRLIIDLSAPVGGSVNEGIDPNLISLTYPQFEDAVWLIKAAGPGTLMAKLDLKAAYRHVPFHPDNQSLLAIRWGGTTYLDIALPFSLCSAPKLVTAIFDGLTWCMVCEGISHFLHHLDGFFFCHPHQAWDSGQSLSVAVKLCQNLGLPVAPDELVGPLTTPGY